MRGSWRRPRRSASRRVGRWRRAAPPARPATAMATPPAIAASRSRAPASARSRSRPAAPTASPTCTPSRRPRSICWWRFWRRELRRMGNLQRLPILLLRLPAVEHVLGGLERVVGLREAHIGRALQDGLDDLLAGAAAVERAARVQRDLVGAIGRDCGRDHDQLARLQVEMRPVPDGAKAVFVNGAGMGRADRVELVPGLQAVLAEGFVANLLAARGAIVAHLSVLCGCQGGRTYSSAVAAERYRTQP